MPTHVEYHYHYYYESYNNFGQNATGQGTISNISTLPTTDYPQSSSAQPETTIRSAQVRSEDQPTTIPSAREVQSEDQPAELKSSPLTTILPGRDIHRADKSIANTTNVDHTIPRNIVVFGQAGSGKSSIINLLAGSSVANVSGGLARCTPSIKHYYISHGGDNYTFWDTPGLDEAEHGTVSLGDDVSNLLNLVKDHGVNLLIYCIRGALVDIARVNYDFFWKIVCVEKVPIVLVVTGLEGRDDMDEWWQENIKTIKKMNMVFAGHACITSWKGRGGMYEKVWKLVREHSTPKPWHMTPGWSAQAQQIIVAYQKHYKARTMRKLLQELRRSLVLS